MNKKTIAIVTGASRGLGEALALQMIADGTPLITVARQTSSALSGKAAQYDGSLTQIQADLSDPQEAQRTSEKIAAQIPDDVARCILINNAGTVQPVANTVRLSDADAITNALTLNVTSIMLLCSAVLQACTRPGIDCRILNISSGAGQGPVAGWGVYCASKAAVNMYTQVLAQEHPEVRAVSLSPGVIDTTMQATIRASSTQDFPNVGRFTDLHEQGQLASATDTAQHILHYLDRDDFGTTVVDDIRNYIQASL